ncbi:hypothetical protein AMS66_17315 [Paenibacillus xylanivorans]|uniref:Uncharacterized protein n=1 Tax=Paenibacillus xylanivorans TaxID=1705561 RepID=A0A0M9BNV2_9BACL|nr:hypothetical protein AMS66_17315 [Paenibacillus xylanivorans]
MFNAIYKMIYYLIEVAFIQCGFPIPEFRYTYFFIMKVSGFNKTVYYYLLWPVIYSMISSVTPPFLFVTPIAVHFFSNKLYDQMIKHVIFSKVLYLYILDRGIH